MTDGTGRSQRKDRGESTLLEFLSSTLHEGFRASPETSVVLAGKYELQSMLGRGSTAVVMAALDRSLDRRVAVKIWSPAAIGAEWGAVDGARLAIADKEEFFRTEARRLAALSHRNLAQIFEFGITREGLPWIAVELVEGGTLRDRIELWRAEGRINPLSDVLDVATQIVDATAYLHETGLYQLDLKPDNVVVAPDRVTLIDIATGLERPSAAYPLNRARYGTPGYVAPEVALGGEISDRSDVFSIGAILMEMLTLANPLADNTLRESAYRALDVREPNLLLNLWATAAFAPDRDQVKDWGSSYLQELRSFDIPAALAAVRFPVPGRLLTLVCGMLEPDIDGRPASSHVLSELKLLRQMTSERGRVFISHARQDKTRFVDHLAHALDSSGVSVWYDSWHLRVGEPFWDHISMVLDAASFVLVVLSNNALESDNVAEELRIARLENIKRVKILPLIIDDIPDAALPPDLRPRQVMRFPLPDDKTGFEAALSRLLSDMRALSKS